MIYDMCMCGNAVKLEKLMKILIFKSFHFGQRQTISNGQLTKFTPYDCINWRIANAKNNGKKTIYKHPEMILAYVYGMCAIYLFY